MAGGDDEILGKAYDSGLAKRLWPYVKPYWRAVALSVAIVPLLNAFQLIQPYLVKRAIDDHIAPGLPDGLIWIGAAFFAALTLEFFALYGQIFLLNYTGQAVVRDLRRDLFQHVIGLAPRFFDRSPVGRLLTRLTNDLEGVSEMFASGIVSLVADVVKLVAITGILFYMNWRLALATLAVSPPLYLLVNKLRKQMRFAFREVRQRMAKLNAYLAEALSGMDLVQVFSQEKRIAGEFAEHGREYRDATYKTVVQDSVLYAVVEFFSALAVAIILWYGGLRIAQEHMSFGELVAFISYIQMFFDPIRDLSAKYATMQSGMASLERIFALRDEDERILDSAAAMVVEEPGLKAPGRGAEIEYVGVWFDYARHTSTAGETPSRWALQNVSFHAKPGDRVALVGATGSGKSTTTKLLNRFYDPQRGAILIDGVDSRAIPLEKLRRRIGVVSQDVYLFSGTILDNVRLFDESISAEQVEEACVAVGLLPMLQRLGRRLDEPVLERGRNFSQGQRQLLSFARVLAFNPDILVLDEATSSVDQETEHVIQQALERIMVGRTSLIVAHRLATIRHCERILVLHHGEIRESGSHRELIAMKGLYEKLHRLQAAIEI